MKLNKTVNVESTIGGLETHTMGIKADGKAFRGLVKGLYSNKIRAFVREISANALDGHTQAGRPDDQFHVDFPTMLDPYFRVRDYGVSMSHDTVFNVFGTLFESTKDDSNDMIGAFGLGSKSPFAYADSFEVTAHLDGERRCYLVSLSDNGIPEITLIATEATDLPNGIEVAVPIRDEDHATVIREGQSVLKWFDVVPTTNGVEIPTIERLHTVASGRGYIVKNDESSWAKQVIVRMGGIAYPLDDYNVNTALGSLKNGYNLVLDVAMGDVSVTMSREALELDEPTRAYLKELAEGVVKEIGDEINARFEGHATRLAAVKDLADNGVKEFWAAGVKYKGETLDYYLSLENDHKDDSILPSVKVGNKRGLVLLRQAHYGNLKGYKFAIARSGTKVVRGTLRYRALVEENGKDATFLLTDPDRKVIERMMRLWGLTSDQFVSIASLPDPGAPTREARNSGPIQGVRSAPRGYDVSALPENDEFYWVEMSRPNRWEFSSLDNKRQELVRLGGNRDWPLLVFNPTAVKRYKPVKGNELDAAKRGLMVGQEADMRKALKNAARWSGCGNRLRTIFKAPAVDHDMVNLANEYFGHDAAVKLVEAERAANLAMRAKYPLLFDNTDDAACEAYVKLIDEADNA